jgi:leader peptidase (prepilin peptidase)/N-methyltransferase
MTPHHHALAYAAAAAAGAGGGLWAHRLTATRYRGFTRLRHAPWFTAAGAATGAATAHGNAPAHVLPAYLVLALITPPLTATDLAEHRLPDRIVYPALGASATLLTAAALSTHHTSALLRAALAALALSGTLLTLAIASGGAIGLGDVKLAALTAMTTGYTGWRELCTGTLAAFTLAALASLALLAARKASRGSEIPLGPFLLTGAVLALAAH